MTSVADAGRSGLRAPQIRLPHFSPLAEGLLGSALILIGSYGVGWLVSISPLSRWDLLLPLRTTPTGVVVSTVALTLGCWLMFHAWLRLREVLHTGEQPLRSISRTAAAWMIPQLFVLPIFSRDVFAYLNQGRLVLQGEDPYTTGVSTLENWFQLGTDIVWAEDATPYGPLFLWLEAAVMRVSADQPDLAVFLFRLACAAGLVLMMIYVPRLARLLGADPARAQWLTAANPLLIISFISSVHNDSLMIGFALAGIYLAATAERQRGRGVLAVLLVTLSIGIKPITMVLLPFIGLLWAWAGLRGEGISLGWMRRLRHWAWTLLIAAAVMLGVGLISVAGGDAYGFGWLEVLGGTGTGSMLWSPVGLADALLTGALILAGMDHGWTLDVLRVVGRALSVVIVLVLMMLPLRAAGSVAPASGSVETVTSKAGTHAQTRTLILRMTWAFAALVLLSPVIQPWYLLWLLPLIAVLRGGEGRGFVGIVLITAFFLAFGAADQLQVWQFLEFGPLAPGLAMTLVSAAVSVLALTLLMVRRGSRMLILPGGESSERKAQHPAP